MQPANLIDLTHVTQAQFNRIRHQGTGSIIAVNKRSPAAYVVAGGVIAGALDILYAWLFWKLKAGVAMERILQSVAAGLLGADSFRGGSATALLGLVLHFLIATSMSAAYYVAARRWRVLVEQTVPSGLAYGLVLYCVMSFVVVPLSAAAPGSRDPLWIGLTIAVHAVFIGLPIALAARRAASVRERPAASAHTGTA